LRLIGGDEDVGGGADVDLPGQDVGAGKVEDGVLMILLLVVLRYDL
jgi:hypothetical protein